MKKIIASLTLALLAPLAHAGGSAVVIAVAPEAEVPALRIQLPADYVAVPISIQSDAKDPIRRADEIEKAVHGIAEALKQRPDLTIKPGAISLSARQDSSAKMFSSYSTPSSTAQLYVLGALKPGTSVFAVTKRIYEAVGALAFGGDTRVMLGNTSLGMNDPEQYRPKLLALLPGALAEVRKALGTSAAFDIDGLHNPVSVMQLNESEVVVFINYRLRAQTKG